MKRAWIMIVASILGAGCSALASSPDRSAEPSEREAAEAVLVQYLDAIVRTDIETMRTLREKPELHTSYSWYKQKRLLGYRVLEVRPPLEDERKGMGYPESGVLIAWVARKLAPDLWPPEWDLATYSLVKRGTSWKIRDWLQECPRLPPEPGDYPSAQP